jgi:serine/threonine-protein kinase
MGGVVDSGEKQRGKPAIDQTAASPVSPTLLNAPDLEPGTIVGDYRIESKVGEGGMGAVYSAVHPLIGKRAAIKVMTPALSVDAVAVDRFVFEARAVNQIGHPRIVDVFAFGRLPDGRSYCVMEWLDGQTLATCLNGARLPLARAVDILLQVCEALDAAHTKGVIHRDLKPENIFLQTQGRRATVKLLDFGVAKLADASEPTDAGGTRKTKQGHVVGTPLYMSPEQASSKSVDQRTDIYALGVTAYEMILGRPPFNCDNATDVMHMHMHDPPPPPSNFWPEIPATVEDLLLKMLAKAPPDRPTLGEVVACLNAVAQALVPEPTGQHVLISNTDPSRRAVLSPRGEIAGVTAERPVRSPWIGRAAIGGAALLVLAVVLVASRGKHAPPPVVITPPAAPIVVSAPPPAAPPPAKPAPAMLSLTINTPARIELDGKPVALSVSRATIPISEAGEHSLDVTAHGRAPHHEVVIARPGAKLELAIKLERAARRPDKKQSSTGNGFMLDPFER